MTAKASAKAAQKAAQTAKVAAKATVQAVKVAAKATVAAVKAIIAGIKTLVAAIAAGGWVAVVIILVLCVVGLIASSCFGIFFSGEDSGTGQTMRQAVQEISAEYQSQIDTARANSPYNELEMSGSRAVWPEVLAVYAVKTTTDPNDPQEVATVDDAIVTVALSQVGNIGGEPYWSWYGFESHVEWCACFVSWCAAQCGYIDTGVCPKFAGCGNGVQWFQEREQWLDGSAKPAPGMIIFFDWDNEGGSGPQDGEADHVGIVERVKDGSIYTVEGNSKNLCRRNSYPVGDHRILGYGFIRK